MTNPTSAETAHLMVNQGVAKLRDLYEDAVRKQQSSQKWKEHSERLQKRIDELEERLAAHRIPRIPVLESRVAELEANERRLQEFMRLKDLAKIKVERTRDLYLRQRNRAEERISKLHDQAVENAELKKLNERQAMAFKDKEAQNVALQKQARDYKKRLDNLLSVMQTVANGGEPPKPNTYGSWNPRNIGQQW